MKLSLLLALFHLWNVTTVTCQVYNFSEEDFDVSDQYLYVCPKETERFLHYPGEVQIIKDADSNVLYIVESQNFLKIIERKIKCAKDEIRLTLQEGSYALMPDGYLVHFHGFLIVPPSHFCFKLNKDSKTRNYSVMWLDAEVCVDVPKAEFCCEEDERIEVKANGGKCVQSRKPPTPAKRSLPVTIDGVPEELIVAGNVSGFPNCQGKGVTFSTGSNQTGGLLRLIQNYLLFELKLESGKHMVLEPSEYCVGPDDDDFITVAFCPHHDGTMCKSEHCISKCCPDDQMYYLPFASCISAMFSETLHIQSLLEKVGIDQKDFSLVTGLPSCGRKVLLESDETNPNHFTMLPDGKVHILPENKVFSQSEYCFDVFTDENLLRAVVMVCL